MAEIKMAQVLSRFDVYQPRLPDALTLCDAQGVPRYIQHYSWDVRGFWFVWLFTGKRETVSAWVAPIDGRPLYRGASSVYEALCAYYDDVERGTVANTNEEA